MFTTRSDPPNKNKTDQVKFEAMLGEVLDIYPNIQSKQPLSIDDGGSSAPMDKALLKTAMFGETGSRVYTGAINFWWHSLRWRPLNNVPVNEKAIEDTARGTLKHPPATITCGLHVVFEHSDQATDIEDLMNAKGMWPRISPEEPEHSLLWAIKYAKERGASDEEMARFEKLLLSYPCTFEMIEKPQMLKRVISLREEYVQQGESCFRTPFARYKEICENRAILLLHKGKVTSDQLFQWYDTVKFAARSEKVTKNVIDLVTAIANKAEVEPSIEESMHLGEVPLGF